MKTLVVTIVVLGSCLGSTPALAQDRQIGGVGLTIFDDRNFRGRSASIREDQSNFQFIGLNDKVSSLQVAPGERWEVCEHANFEGRCAVVSGEERDLRSSGWNDIISSARRLRGGGRGGGRGFIRLYDQRRYRGTSIQVDGQSPFLQEFTNRAESVRVNGGAWELCERPNFSGRCVVVSGDLDNLGALGLANRVGSVRPAVGRR